MAIYFNGKKRVSPGVFSAVDDRNMLPLRASVGSVVALVGFAGVRNMALALVLVAVWLAA